MADLGILIQVLRWTCPSSEDGGEKTGEEG